MDGIGIADWDRTLLADDRVNMDEALGSRIMTKSQLTELLVRSKGRPGAALLQKLLERRAGPAPTRAMRALAVRPRCSGTEARRRLRASSADHPWR